MHPIIALLRTLMIKDKLPKTPEPSSLFLKCKAKFQGKGDISIHSMQIKFFERVKLERRMETLKKDVARAGLSEQERSAAATRLEQCTLDLQVKVCLLFECVYFML